MSSRQANRRDFLRTTGAFAAAGLAAPYVFTSATARGEGSANDKLNMALIGAGGRGQDDGPEAVDLGMNLVACADVHLGNAKEFIAVLVEKFGQEVGKGCQVYQDYHKLLARPDIDGVIICTPDHWHVKVAIDAMKAGKHVYCEKPLTLTLAEGDLICEAVKKYKKTFQVATQQRSAYELKFLKAVAIARSGRLGNNLHAECGVGMAGSRMGGKSKFGPFQTADVPAVLNWDMWLGQAPDVPFCPDRINWDFRWWYEYAGGQVTDWGAHHIDIAMWALAGKDGQVVEADPKSSKFFTVPREQVLAFLLGKIPAKEMPLAFNVAHEFDVDLKLSTGSTIQLTSGDNAIVLSGDKGRIRVNRERLTGKPVEEIDADPKAQKEIEELMGQVYGESYEHITKPKFGHMVNFFECVKSGKLPVANVWEHVRSVNGCHLANISLLVGRKVQWDPQAKQFINDEEANGLRQRKQRAPYEIHV